MLNLMKKKFPSPCGDKLKYLEVVIMFYKSLCFRPLAGIS